MVNVHASIAAALEIRRTQRPSVDKLYSAWRELGESVDALLAGSGGLEGEVPLDSLRKLSTEIAEGTPEMAAIRARFYRDTVNIGVIGRSKAGKSTLLRTITGLGEDALPTSKDNPTTAARSRIQHFPGRADAEISLYAWEEFREHYLKPLHRDAGCKDAVPATTADFLKYPYHRMLESSREPGSSDREIFKQQFLDRLCVAQDSFESYRGYLTGPERTLAIRRLADLRPFVAYPADDSRHRPYHAVRDVRIYCQFKVGDVEQLVLVDLPGAGEAALDVDAQFLADLRNEVDVLMQVKLPAMTEAYLGDQDFYVLRLADRARMGVDHADFLAFVINTYPDKVDSDSANNLWRQAQQKITDSNGVQLRVGDVKNPDDVRVKILGPVLDHLATRLASMDRQAAQTQIDKALEAAEAASTLAGQLGAEVSRLERLIPDEQQALRKAANDLRGEVGHQMDKLRQEYDKRAREQEPVKELTAAIAEAREELLKWAAAGFGKGSKREWLTTVERFMSVDPGETRDDQCTLARQRIRTVFGEIDSSIADAIDRLHLDVAKVLRDGLTSELVPDDDRPLDALRETASGLSALHLALKELVGIQAGYGSVFLRVGGPVVRHIRPVAGTVGGDGPPGQSGSAGGPASFYESARIAATGGLRAHAAGAAGAVHPAAVAAVHVATTAGPLIADWIRKVQVQVADESAAGLHEGLTRSFREAVAVIEERMREEASQLTQVLAAAMDQFFDSFARTPDVQEEWAVLCAPIKETLWPHIFGAGAADEAARLGRLAETVSRAGAAAGEIRAAAAGMARSDARD